MHFPQYFTVNRTSEESQTLQVYLVSGEVYEHLKLQIKMNNNLKGL